MPRGIVLYRQRKIGEVTLGLDGKSHSVFWKDLSHGDDGPLVMVGRINYDAKVFKTGDDGKPTPLTKNEKSLIAVKEALLAACQSLLDQGADLAQLDTVTEE